MTRAGCLRSLRGVAAALVVGAGCVAAAPLRVCLISASATTLEPLRQSLGADPAFACTVLTPPPAATGDAAWLAPLGQAEAAVFLHGPGAPLRDADRESLQAFAAAGRGCLVLGATRDAWAAAPEFIEERLGGTPGAPFARGAPMTIIQLYPHAIFTGVPRLETDEAIPAWSGLAGDTQMIMEGTVGEQTTPLGWVRVRPTGRLCHLVPAAPATLRDAAYQRLIAQALLWTARRPIPGARPVVQRTFMPEAHPGAIAVTFPSGPGVCLDPVRGGINYAWDGDFLDLRPRWLTKPGAPARIFGPVFYTEKLWQPLRSGAPNAAPAYRFRGYTLHPDGPEFHYEVAGRDVHERLTALPDGAGFRRHFRVGPGPSPLWLTLEPQAGAALTVAGAARDGERLSFTAPEGGEFTVTLKRKEAGALP